MRTAAGFFLLLSLSLPSLCQTPEQAHARARAEVLKHSPDEGFSLDGTSEGIEALRRLWDSEVGFVVNKLHDDPHATDQQLEHSLCLLVAEPTPVETVPLSAEEQCADGRRNNLEVAHLTPQLILVAPSFEEMGNVVLLSRSGENFKRIWSVADTEPQAKDPRHLAEAWRIDRLGMDCREGKAAHPPGRCGPLFGSMIVLPSDAAGHPRFAIDAEYAQSMGATVGKQTSIWRWTGDHAELEWIDWYDYMIDQDGGTTFDEDKHQLIITEKTDFRTVYSCGSCIERPVEHRLLLTENGIKDLGSRSLTPEADRIDELLYRLGKGRPTGRIAAPEVARFLRAQMQAAARESAKIEAGWVSAGMGGFVTVLTPHGAQVCLDADGLDGATLVFSMHHTGDGGYFITAVRRSTEKDCPSPAPWTTTVPPS